MFLCWILHSPGIPIFNGSAIACMKKNKKKFITILHWHFLGSGSLEDFLKNQAILKVTSYYYFAFEKCCSFWHFLSPLPIVIVEVCSVVKVYRGTERQMNIKNKMIRKSHFYLWPSDLEFTVIGERIISNLKEITVEILNYCLLLPLVLKVFKCLI